MSLVSPGLHGLNSDLQSELWEEKDGNTPLLSQHLIQIYLVSIQAKHFAINSFIFLHEVIPRGRKKSNVLCENVTLIKACFVILHWGKPEASRECNDTFNAGLPGKGDWTLGGLHVVSLALLGFEVLRLRSQYFPPSGKILPAGWEGSKVVTAEAATSYKKVLRSLPTLSQVNPYHKEWGILGRIRKAPEVKKQSRKISGPIDLPKILVLGRRIYTFQKFPRRFS